MAHINLYALVPILKAVDNLGLIFRVFIYMDTWQKWLVSGARPELVANSGQPLSVRNPYHPSRWQWRPEERYIPRVSAPFFGSSIRAVGDSVVQDLEPRLRHNFRVLQTETHFLRDSIDHLSSVVSEMSARLGRHLDTFSERQPVQAEVVETEALKNANPIAGDARKNPEQQSIQATTSATQEELAALKKARAEDQLRLEQLEVDLELARKRARLARFETERMRGDPRRNKLPNIFSSNLPTSGSQKRVPVGTILQTGQNPTTTQRVSKPKSSSRPLIRSAFLNLRQALDEFSTSSALQLGPLPSTSAGLDSSQALCPPDVWNSLSAQQRSQRVMAKIFEILWDDILRPDLFSFGLEGVKLTNDSDKTVSQPEKQLRTLEKRFLELGVGTSTLQAWRRSVITTSAPLRDPTLSLAPIASKIFKALSPVIQFVFARNAEKVKAQMLKICRDAMELKLLLRSEEGNWKIELHLHSGEIKGIEPGAKELEHRIALFGALTKGDEGKSQGARTIVDRAWTVLVAKADQDQKRMSQEGARSFDNAEPAPGYIRDSVDHFTLVTRKPRLKVRDEGGAPVPVNFKSSAKPPIKSLPEIARERREILAKAKAREEKARQRSPVRPSISPQRMRTSKTPGPGSTKLEVEEEKKGIASFLLGPSQQHTATPTNHEPPPAPPAPQQLSFKHLLLDETTEESAESSTSSILLPPRDVREVIIPEQQFLKQQNITTLRDGVALREGEDVTSETVQAICSTSVKEREEPVRDQLRLEASTSTVPSMMKKIKKRKRPTNDDKWGLKSYKPENDPRGDRDSEDSSNSSAGEFQTDGRMTLTTRSSTPASGTVRSATATLDFGSSSITVGRTIGGGTSQSTATVGREELDGELLTGTASRKRRKKPGKVGGEDGLSEESVRGDEVGSTTAVLAKVLALFDDSG
ncbi:hypothetical protein QBC42DRAFT_333767 [Cladorrhinum samala]|uniref:Uncharacterized protein n=1 Tax=Cladorrhinum samala TaxID=585594 RepID=A0AAV9HH43_9PEZI|nr:hypothetical protein QBC42DRAFT_333767 [Cladorrhinum samala]